MQRLKNTQPGTTYSGLIKVLRKVRSAPLIYQITDGELIIDAVSTVALDKSVYEVSGTVHIRNDKQQLAIKQIQKSTQDWQATITKLASPHPRDLSISSERLEKMHTMMKQIAQRIRQAIVTRQPIIIRYHCDADGICSMLAIDKACRNLLKELHENPKYLLYGNVCKTPYYSMSDALKDVAFSAKYIEQKPLLVIVDNGSTSEDAQGVALAMAAGTEVIIIDHHTLSEQVPVTLHLNPRLFGFDGDITAGMLCYEIGRLIHPSFEAPMLPAISSTGDKSSGPEAQAYQKDKSDLMLYSRACDYIIAHMPFDLGSEIYWYMLEHKEFFDIISKAAQHNIDEQVKLLAPTVQKHTSKHCTIYLYDLNHRNVSLTYPGPGKLTGILHDRDKQGTIVTLGLLTDILIVRESEPIIPIETMIKQLHVQFPDLSITGGGHECAGSIKFPQQEKDRVIPAVIDMLMNA